MVAPQRLVAPMRMVASHLVAPPQHMAPLGLVALMNSVVSLRVVALLGLVAPMELVVMLNLVIAVRLVAPPGLVAPMRLTAPRIWWRPCSRRHRWCWWHHQFSRVQGRRHPQGTLVLFVSWVTPADLCWPFSGSRTTAPLLHASLLQPQPPPRNPKPVGPLLGSGAWWP